MTQEPPDVCLCGGQSGWVGSTRDRVNMVKVEAPKAERVLSEWRERTRARENEREREWHRHSVLVWWYFLHINVAGHKKKNKQTLFTLVAVFIYFLCFGSELSVITFKVGTNNFYQLEDLIRTS